MDCSQVDGRVEAITHFLQRADSAHGRVDYEISVPPAVNVSVRNASGPIHLNGLNADISLRSDTAAIEVRDLSNAHLRVMTVNGPVTLQNVSGGYVEVLSSGGDVHLNSVSGPKVTVSTTSGSISYAGDFGHGGEYSLTKMQIKNVSPIRVACNLTGVLNGPSSADGRWVSAFPDTERTARDRKIAKKKKSRDILNH